MGTEEKENIEGTTEETAANLEEITTEVSGSDEISAEQQAKNEERIKRRRKERMQAIGVLAGIVIAIVLVVSLIIGGVVHTISNKKKSRQELLAQQAQEEVEEDYEDEYEDEVDEDEVILDESDAGDEVEESQAEESQVEESDEIQQADDSETEVSSEEQVVDSEEMMEAQTGMSDEAVLELVNSQISQMTKEEKVAQLFIVTPEQLMGREAPIDSVGSDFNLKLNDRQVGGIVIREGNMKDAENVAAMTSNIALMAHSNMFIGVCEEGGAKSPFVTSEVTENVMSSQKEIGESQGEAGAYSSGISIGSELKQYGFNLDFGPLADTPTFGASLVADRSFSDDLETNKNLAKGVVQGLSDQGVISCVKYFPSYSDVAATRGGQMVSQRSKADLESEAEVYKAAIEAGSEMLMISHVSLPKIRGDKRPASLSKEIITDIVRDEWGYDGIVITDFMDQPCIYQKYTYAEAAVGAIEAGADMLLSTKNFEKSYQGILDAVNKGTLTEERIDESIHRILMVKYRHQ